MLWALTWILPEDPPFLNLPEDPPFVLGYSDVFKFSSSISRIRIERLRRRAAQATLLAQQL